MSAVLCNTDEIAKRRTNVTSCEYRALWLHMDKEGLATIPFRLVQHFELFLLLTETIRRAYRGTKCEQELKIALSRLDGGER